MSLFISPTDDLSADAQARRSALRAMLEARDAAIGHAVVYKKLQDNAVKSVQEELMNWSRSCLLDQVRFNDINAEWYHWRVDRAMFGLVVKDEEFPYENAAPKGSHTRPHSLEWATYWKEQLDRYSKTLDQTVVSEIRGDPIEIQADGTPVKESDNGSNESGNSDNAPWMARSTQPPRQTHWDCANCGEAGHTLGDCVTPVLAGCDIDGCPLCNSKKHLFDQCHNVRYLNTETILNILYFRRAGKCQIRSDREIFVLFKEYVEHLESQERDVSEILDAACPWSRAFTFEFLQKSDSAAKIAAYRGYGTNGPQPLEEDPTVAQEDITAGKVSSAYCSYQEKKVAAAFAAYMQHKNAQ